MPPSRFALVPSDCADPSVFETIFRGLDMSARHMIGPANPRLLVIPIHGDDGAAVGGLWGFTQFQWLHLEMLYVPEPLRGQGIGSALVAAAEEEARTRGCLGVRVETFSFQAVPFYQDLGYVLFGVLDDLPPGQALHYFRKRLDAPFDIERQDRNDNAPLLSGEARPHSDAAAPANS